eukprot:gnl/Spiro4/12431_TR6566_c0_g2_i2.p1 gnl/Spiro4/12431_TR6566_c0_g2~~gnl/Spiro4/12431_TR6566_c0_g2_i2.p1  ORF type:complete len:115 (-),score=13.35 gnl/Spiro4/12431_TR6566_c0_g2_i2:77-421(-)
MQKSFFWYRFPFSRPECSRVCGHELPSFHVSTWHQKKWRHSHCTPSSERLEVRAGAAQIDITPLHTSLKALDAFIPVVSQAVGHLKDVAEAVHATEKEFRNVLDLAAAVLKRTS